MLISHLKRFIYLKTLKTAGTSIETYFERYCVGPGEYPGEQHAIPALISEWGIVGSRGPAARHPVWRNHLAAPRVRELVGETIWDTYLKFCAIRNPFDKVVSQFWFALPDERRRQLQAASFDAVRASFSSWVHGSRLPLDRGVYCIDGSLAVDVLIRYEHLLPDLRAVCLLIGVPWEPERLGRYKSEYRARGEPFPLYYDDGSERHVREHYAWEIEQFGYCNR